MAFFHLRANVPVATIARPKVKGCISLASSENPGAQSSSAALMYLTHYAAPKIAVPLQPTARKTANAIKANFTPFKALPVSQQLPLSHGALALTLMADSRWGLSHFAAFGWVSSATTVDAAGQMRASPQYCDLPTHWKGVVSQTMGTAASLATAALTLGFDFFATRPEIEAICTLLGGEVAPQI